LIIASDYSKSDLLETMIKKLIFGQFCERAFSEDNRIGFKPVLVLYYKP